MFCFKVRETPPTNRDGSKLTHFNQMPQYFVDDGAGACFDVNRQLLVEKNNKKQCFIEQQPSYETTTWSLNDRLPILFIQKVLLHCARIFYLIFGKPLSDVVC